jgi:hypothetical protein
VKLADLHERMLATPVITHSWVPRLAVRTGYASAWAWPAKSWDRVTGEYELPGSVYFGRTGNGLIKIGFGSCAAVRVLAQKLDPLLVLLDAGFEHEKALHQLFARELVHGRECFYGPGVETFVSVARAWSTETFGQTYRANELRTQILEASKPASGRSMRSQLDAMKRTEAHRFFRSKARFWFAQQAARSVA